MAKKSTSTSKKKDDIIYMGIDLGTSRSAVAASNGRRLWVESYVAWPRDFVARKMLQRDVLFGEEAVKHRLSVDLVRPLEFGVIKDGTRRNEEAVRALIHHLIEEAQPDEGQKIYAAVGVPAEALRVNKMAIRDAVREYADALMVVSEPFAVAYGQNALTNALIIDIGAGTTDFCVMHGTMPTEEDQRTLTLAGDSIDRRMLEVLRERYPTVHFSDQMVRQLKEEHGFVGASKSKVTTKVTIDGKVQEIDITDALRSACESIVAPIAETTIDLLSHYEPEFQEMLRRNVFLAGGGSQIKGIAEALEKALAEYSSFKVTTVGEALFAGADGALALTQDMPEEYWEDM
ncbi:MAG: rod shape-determining protein [Bacteroidota bacterium]